MSELGYRLGPKRQGMARRDALCAAWMKRTCINQLAFASTARHAQNGNNVQTTPSRCCSWQAYEGHFQDAGWNGIEFAGAAHCWAQRLEVVNSDNPIIVASSSFITVSDILMTR